MTVDGRSFSGKNRSEGDGVIRSGKHSQTRGSEIELIVHAPCPCFDGEDPIKTGRETDEMSYTKKII